MDQKALNILRRCAGVPQDFSAPITEDVGNPILGGGKHRFYLVGTATPGSELGDVISEVDTQSLVNIVLGSMQGDNWRDRVRQYELFPSNEKNDALDLARKRIAEAGSVKESYGHMSSANADNVAYPKLHQKGLEIYNQYTFNTDNEEEEGRDLPPSGMTRDDVRNSETARGEAEAGAGMGMPDEEHDYDRDERVFDPEDHTDEADPDYDERTEPELDRQTDFNAPPRDDGDDSHDFEEEEYEVGADDDPVTHRRGKKIVTLADLEKSSGEFRGSGKEYTGGPGTTTSSSAGDEVKITKMRKGFVKMQNWRNKDPKDIMGQLYWFKDQLPPDEDSEAWQRNWDKVKAGLEKKYPEEQNEYEEYEEQDEDFEPDTNICPDCVGSTGDAPADPNCERCGGAGEIYEADLPAKASVVAGLTQTINHLDRTAKQYSGGDEDDREHAETMQHDMKDYKTLLRVTKAGQWQAARKYYEGLDTASRDHWIEANKSNEKTTNALLKYFDAELLHEKKAAKDYDGDGEVESSEDEHKGVVDKAIKKSKKKSKGKTKMKEGKKAAKDYDGDGKVESSEDEHKGVVDKAIKKSKKKSKVKEAHYHTDDNYPLSHHEDPSDAINTATDYDTVFDQNDKVGDDQKEEDFELTNDETKVSVPSRILTALKDRIAELKAEGEKAKPRDFERAGYYEDTTEAFQTVYDLLNDKTVEGFKRAQIYSQRMMNVQRALFPDEVWKFIVDGGSKRSLKSYMSPVDTKFPVSGEPLGIVPIDVLNKNTNTQ